MPIPLLLLMIRMAEALAPSAIFALSVKLQFPRRTKMTSPANYKHTTKQFNFKSMELPKYKYFYMHQQKKPTTNKM